MAPRRWCKSLVQRFYWPSPQAKLFSLLPPLNFPTTLLFLNLILYQSINKSFLANAVHPSNSLDPPGLEPGRELWHLAVPCCAVLRCSGVSASLRPHGPQPARLLCPRTLWAGHGRGPWILLQPPSAHSLFPVLIFITKIVGSCI